MKTLVVYYSFEGNTELIAQTIAQEIEADLLKLEVKQSIKTHSFLKFFWGGRQAMMKAKPELLPLQKNPQDYDLILIGTPVWAFTFSPALRTFFATNKFSQKKIAVFCCHEGGLKNTLQNMKAELVGNEIVGEKDFFAPLKQEKETTIQKAREWAKSLVIK